MVGAEGLVVLVCWYFVDLVLVVLLRLFVKLVPLPCWLGGRCLISRPLPVVVLLLYRIVFIGLVVTLVGSLRGLNDLLVVVCAKGRCFILILSNLFRLRGHLLGVFLLVGAKLLMLRRLVVVVLLRRLLRLVAVEAAGFLRVFLLRNRFSVRRLLRHLVSQLLPLTCLSRLMLLRMLVMVMLLGLLVMVRNLVTNLLPLVFSWLTLRHSWTGTFL